MVSNVFGLVSFVIAFWTAAAPSTFAADGPIGIWNVEQGTVRVADCGNGTLCATLASAKQPNDPQTGKPKTDIHNPDPGKRNRPLVGLQIFSGMQQQGPNKWGGGRLYNPEDGNSYDANIILESANVLTVSGCVMFICKSRTWRR
jgi:uncharacterized protein (DUF2147 family)